jgi:hypothetical protein
MQRVITSRLYDHRSVLELFLLEYSLGACVGTPGEHQAVFTVWHFPGY